MYSPSQGKGGLKAPRQWGGSFALRSRQRGSGSTAESPCLLSCRFSLTKAV